MGRLGMVGMGWLVEACSLWGVIAFGTPNLWSARQNAGATPTTSHNRAIHWVGTIVQLLSGIVFYIVLFVAFLILCLRTATVIWRAVML